MALLTVVLTACGVSGDGAGDSETNASSNGNGPVLGGAGSGNTNSSGSASCDLPEMRSWVYDNMQDYYLFADQVEQNINLSEFDTIEDLITDLRVTPYDRFSYISDEQSYQAFFDAGQTFGFGWRLLRTSSDEFYFSLIEPASPLANAGVQRGDKMLAIDGYLMADFLALDSTAKSAILGTGSEIVTPTFSIQDDSGLIRDLQITKATFNMQTVTENRVITDNGVRVGYLHFYQFLETSKQELDDTFAELATANIDELVLDLRFNTGGRVDVAAELASRIVGNGGDGQVFAHFAYNQKYAASSQNLMFPEMPASLNMSRVYVLSSDDTCSASEMVINGLSPFIDVITVGGKSCGKPYGTSPETRCGKVMNALEVEFQNANGVGGYFDGIAADCSVADNVQRSLGSPAEPLLGAALSHISTASCGTFASSIEDQFRNSGRQPNQLPLPAELLPARGAVGSL